MTTDTNLIQQYIPQDLREKASKFRIPEKFLKEKPELIILVLRSRSMDTDQEKQSWFNLLPLMTQEQLDKLNDILTREKIKLAEIEQKYEEKKKDIKEKYIKRWQAMGYNKKMESIKEKEEAHREKDMEAAEDLLESI